MRTESLSQTPEETTRDSTAKMHAPKRVPVIGAKNHKRQRRKRQSETAKREKSQTPVRNRFTGLSQAQDPTLEISRLFLTKVDQFFCGPPLPSSEKRLGIPVSLSVDAASRSQPTESFKNICQNRNFLPTLKPFSLTFLDFTNQLFFYSLFPDLPAFTDL